MTLEPLEFFDENIPCLAACPVNTPGASVC